MFATLVLALPSTSSGGELAAHHQEHEVHAVDERRHSRRIRAFSTEAVTPHR
jgi:hypothetical protein